MNISWSDFAKIQMRVGTITKVTDFEKAKKPAYILLVDFGDKIGVRKTSAQIKYHYTQEQLIGKQVIAVVNFPSKQIANIMSECLVMGIYDDDDHVILIKPDQMVPNGSIIG